MTKTSNYTTLDNSIYFKMDFKDVLKVLSSLDFKTNWNNKLQLDIFPTYRKTDHKKYTVGKDYAIISHNQVLGVVNCVSIISLPPSKLTNEVAYLDCGYNKIEMLNILSKIHKDFTLDADFSWIFMRWIEYFPDLLRMTVEKNKETSTKANTNKFITTN